MATIMEVFCPRMSCSKMSRKQTRWFIRFTMHRIFAAFAEGLTTIGFLAVFLALVAFLVAFPEGGLFRSYHKTELHLSGQDEGSEETTAIVGQSSYVSYLR